MLKDTPPPPRVVFLKNGRWGIWGALPFQVLGLCPARVCRLFGDDDALWTRPFWGLGRLRTVLVEVFEGRDWTLKISGAQGVLQSQQGQVPVERYVPPLPYRTDPFVSLALMASVHCQKQRHSSVSISCCEESGCWSSSLQFLVSAFFYRKIGMKSIAP